MWRQRWSELRRGKSGITLVELIVTFALIGLFMTAASFVLTSSLKMFTRMQSVSSAVTVSDILMDKITGEISAAKPPDRDSNDVASAGYYIWLGKDIDSNWITLWNRSGSPMAIYAEPEGALCLKYYETTWKNTEAGEAYNKKTVPEMDWHFDKGVYMGYHITKLTFTREDSENHPNVIRIDLEIHNDRTNFTYQASRYAECYNYKFNPVQVKKYLCVRPEEKGMPEDIPPERAIDFSITKDVSTDEPDESEGITFKVISRVQQQDGAYLCLQETVYTEKMESQFILIPEDKLVYDGRTYKCLSSELNFKIGADTAQEYYFYYELFSEDGYFQEVIPLDPNGWWRDSDTPVNNENGNRQQTVNPGGIAKWADSSSGSYYYVVINQISGLGWSTQSPGYFNESYVIQIPDLEILNFEELAPALKPWEGAAFHARVFSYKGNYYVRTGYEAPLGSPEEQASEWYKLP